MSDYWKDRRPPAERLPDCERLLEAAQDDIGGYRGTIDILNRHIKTIEAERDQARAEIKRLHQCIRIAAESTDSFMRANERLRAERNEALIKLDEMVEIGNKAEFWEREFKRLRDHCERVTGTSPVDIGEKDD